jgi:hypothetical protein
MFKNRVEVSVGETVQRDGFVFADLELTKGTELTTKERS